MNDLDFVQGCIKGDQRSWNEFLTRYFRLIYHYIYNILAINGHRYTQDEIADIYQEVFTHLIKDNYKKLSSYKGKNGCTLASWLRQVTINFTLDYLDKLKNPRVSLEDSLEDGLSLKDLLRDSAPQAAEFLSSQEKLKTLEDCIGYLDVDEKYFMELFLNQGLKLEQLTSHLKLSRGAVDMRKSRIMKKLEDCFRSKGFALDFTD